MSLSAACNFTASASTVSATGTLYAAAGTLCTLALVDSTSVYHGDVSIDCDLIPEAGQQFRLNPHGWSAKFQLPPIDTVLDVTVTVSDVNGSTAQLQFNLVVVKDGLLAVTLFGADPTGSVDSSGAFQAAVNALAGTGVALYVPGGTFRFLNPVTLPSNTHIILSESTTMLASMTPGSVTTAIFNALRVDGTTTTIAATGAPGATTVQVTADIQAIGGWIFLYDAASGHLRAKLYQVKSKSGSGPYTYTVDRPIKYALAVNDVAQAETINQNIRIDGNGALFTGTTSRYMELIACVRSYVRDVRVDNSGGGIGNDYCFSWDTAGYENEFRNIRGDGAGTATALCAVEAGENCRVIDCVAVNMANSGYMNLNTIGTTFLNCRASKCTNFGIQSGGDGNSLGTQETQVIGGDYSNNGSYGIVFTGGFSNGAMGATCDSNGQYGIAVGNGVATAETSIVGCSLRQNVQGIVTDALSTKTSIVGCTINLTTAGTYGLDLAGPADIDACQITASVASSIAILPQASGHVTIRGCTIDISGGGSSVKAIEPSAGRVDVTNCQILAASGQFAVLTATAGTVLSMSDTKVSGAAYAVYVNDNTTFRQGHGCDFDTCTNKVTLNSGAAYWNRGSVTTSNGATAVAFPDMKSADRVMLTPTGAAPTAYVNSKTAGTGFSVTDSGAHTYDYVVE